MSEAVAYTAGGNNCVRKGRIEWYSVVGVEPGVTGPGPWGRRGSGAAMLDVARRYVK